MNNAELKRTPVQFVDATSASSKPTKTTIISAVPGDRNIIVANATGLYFVTSATRKPLA